MKKIKLQKMIMWTCDKWTEKKCESQYPCQLMLPSRTTIENAWCAMHIQKAKWKQVPLTKLTV